MIRKLKRALGIEFSLKALLRNPDIYRQQWRLPRQSFTEMVHRRLHAGTPVTVVQIGANDGISNDPLGDMLMRCAQSITSALLVEPQGPAHTRLAQRYRANPNIHCLKSAIDWEPGRRTLFSIDPQQASARLGRRLSDGIASFCREHVRAILAEKGPGLSAEEIDGLITSENVAVSTLPDALHGAGICGAPTVMLIDTEGFDGQILRMVAANDLWPDIIRYEHKHLEAEERRDVARLLMTMGYRLWADHADAWGHRQVPHGG